MGSTISDSCSSILAQFEALASAAPDAAALIDAASGTVTSREGLARRASEIARLLGSAGLQQGDLLALKLPNSTDFVATVLASLQIGTTLVPLDRDARSAEISGIATGFGIRALLGLPARHGPEDEKVEVTLFEGASRPRSQPRPALLKLTSGSTGRPKGIETTESNLEADCRNICSSMDIAPSDLNLGAIPFSHSYGFSNLVMPLLLTGTPIVVSNDYLPLSLLNLANRYGCTVVPGIPMMFDHLSQLSGSDGGFETVRTFISAGAPLDPKVSKAFRGRFGKEIHSFYGCSECGGIAYDREGGSVERGTVGAALDGVRLSINSATGRLAVQSDAVAAGYLEATGTDAARFTPDAGEGCSFSTDDLGEFSARGELTLKGRIGDLINTAGKKVNPREIESILLEMEGIREAKVYGEPAGARGEVVAAAIVADGPVTPQQIREFCRLRLSPHKVPRVVKLIDSIPLDERGKVKRTVLIGLG